MIFYLVAIAYIFFSIYKIYSWIYVSKWKDTEEKLFETLIKDEYETNYIILIPGLREVSLVNKTMDYFTKLDYPRDKTHIVFVTTDEEMKIKQEKRERIKNYYEKIKNSPNLSKINKYNNGLFPCSYLKNVLNILQKIISDNKKVDELYSLYDSMPCTGTLIVKNIEMDSVKYKNFYHIACPDFKIDGGKPTQLNYAVEHLWDIIDITGINLDNLYLGVYDFDSRPDVRTLKYIASKNSARKLDNKKSADFYQQTQLPLDGLQDIERICYMKSLIKANIIMYTRRALGIELYKLKKYEKYIASNKNNKNVIFKPAINCLGAGMFIKLNVLKEICGFAEPVEDLVLGYKLNVLNKEIVTIPYINIMQPYYNITSMINSHSRIFMIGLRLHKEKLKINEFGSFILALKEFVECLIWLLFTPLIWYSYTMLLLNKDRYIVLSLLILTIFIRFYLDIFLLIKESQKLIENHSQNESKLELTVYQAIKIIAISPVLGIIRFITAFIGIGKFIYFYVLKKKKKRKKTER